MYDFLIVGSGLAGLTFAYEANKIGKKCLIIEKRSHLGGNIYNEKIDGINVHFFGSHIFHCNDEETWQYVNQFTSFNNYTHRPKAISQGKLYSFPVNLMTLYQVFGVKTPNEAKKLLEEIKVPIKSPKNLEEWCISQIGTKLYEMFFKGYSEKQWNRNPKDLPASIAKRIPIRLDFNDNYYNHKYQGIPIGGYNTIINNMIKGIDYKLNFDFNTIKDIWKSLAKKLVYSGSLDELYDYRFGDLQYRTLRWEHEKHEGDYQGVSIVNYCDKEVPYTRIVEHKHFELGTQPNTIITKEYSEEFTRGKERLYPIEDDKNRKLHKQYKELADKDGIVCIGRLSRFVYFDMNQVFSNTLKIFKELTNPS